MNPSTISMRMNSIDGIIDQCNCIFYELIFRRLRRWRVNDYKIGGACDGYPLAQTPAPDRSNPALVKKLLTKTDGTG